MDGGQPIGTETTDQKVERLMREALQMKRMYADQMALITTRLSRLETIVAGHTQTRGHEGLAQEIERLGDKVRILETETQPVRALGEYLQRIIDGLADLVMTRLKE